MSGLDQMTIVNRFLVSLDKYIAKQYLDALDDYCESLDITKKVIILKDEVMSAHIHLLLAVYKCSTLKVVDNKVI